MNSRARHILSLLLGFALLAAAGLGLYVIVRESVRVFTSLNSDIAVAIIAAAATIFVSVLSIVLGKVYEAKSLVQKEHRERKVPVYEDLMQFMFKVLMSSKTGESVSEKEMMDFMFNFNQRMMVWGSDEVLAAWVAWRRQAVNGSEPLGLMFRYEKLVFAIRQDLGHQNKKLGTGDILSLFINDIDQHLPARRS
jgi:hypothetical protein